MLNNPPPIEIWRFRFKIYHIYLRHTPLFGIFSSPYTSFCSQSGEESAAWPEAGCVSGETKARKTSSWWWVSHQETWTLLARAPAASACLHQFNWLTLVRAALSWFTRPTRPTTHSASALPVRAMASCLAFQRTGIWNSAMFDIGTANDGLPVGKMPMAPCSIELSTSSL